MVQTDFVNSGRYLFGPGTKEPEALPSSKISVSYALIRQSRVSAAALPVLKRACSRPKREMGLTFIHKVLTLLCVSTLKNSLVISRLWRFSNTLPVNASTHPSDSNKQPTNYLLSLFSTSYQAPPAINASDPPFLFSRRASGRISTHAKFLLLPQILISKRSVTFSFPVVFMDLWTIGEMKFTR
jgi:hypothetical protein